MSSIIDSTSFIMSEFSPEFSFSVTSAPISSWVNKGSDVLSISTVSGSSTSEILMLSTKLASGGV